MRIAARLFATCLLALALAAGGCGKKAEPEVPKSTDGTFPPSSSSFAAEFTPFQGQWAVTKLEVPEGGNSPDVGPVGDDVRQKIVVKVTGTLAKLDLPTGAGPSRYFALTLNPQPSPRQLDLIESDEEGDTGPRPVTTKKGGKAVDVPRDRYAGIYKFEGDTTVIALPLDSRAARPKEFKPALVSVPGGKAQIPVVVVRLKKK